MNYETFLRLCSTLDKTPTTVGREIGINKTTISFWKTGRSKPSPSTVMKISEYFNLDYDGLQNGEIRPKRDNTLFGIQKPPKEEAIKATGGHVVLDSDDIKMIAEFTSKYIRLNSAEKANINSLIDLLLEDPEDN